jgi:hypothetical protein
MFSVIIFLLKGRTMPQSLTINMAMDAFEVSARAELIERLAITTQNELPEAVLADAVEAGLRAARSSMREVIEAVGGQAALEAWDHMQGLTLALTDEDASIVTKTLNRDTGNVVFVSIDGQCHILSPEKARRLAGAIASEAYFASENQALRRAWQNCRQALEAVQAEGVLPDHLTNLISEKLRSAGGDADR